MKKKVKIERNYTTYRVLVRPLREIDDPLLSSTGSTPTYSIFIDVSRKHHVDVIFLDAWKFPCHLLAFLWMLLPLITKYFF